MARKLFISFLGTSFYKECIYHDDNVSSLTRFIQYATLKQIGAEKWTENDSIKIFMTQKAQEANWNEEMKTRCNINTGKEEPYIGLGAELANLNLKAKVEAVNIVDGKDENEIWEIFKSVYDEIEEGDELYIDLTHAFRYMPMLMLVLSNYAKFLKNVTVEHLSYGNYEARDRTTNMAPIVDLLPLTMLQDWTNAASEYIRHGYAGSLKEAIKDELQPLLRNDARRTDNVKNVNKLGSVLEDFANERITCRGISIINGNAAQKLKNQTSIIEDTGIAPLNPIFEKLKSFAEQPDNETMRCYKAAVWCYKRQLYQQAITLLLEGVTTFFCLRCGIDIDDEVRRDYVGQAFHIKEKELSKDEKNDDIRVHDNSYLQHLLNDDLLKNATVVHAYNDLGGTRNDFNHAGFRRTRIPLKPEQMISKIGKALETFHDVFFSQSNSTKERVEEQEKILINISNHPSSSWSIEQITAAKQYGEIVDMKFPQIPADSSPTDIKDLANSIRKQIINNYKNSCLTVHIMGEMTFTYELISLLKEDGIRCVASSSERDVEDLGKGKRVVQFNFVRFRDY